jgi:hypothetical protein
MGLLRRKDNLWLFKEFTASAQGLREIHSTKFNFLLGAAAVSFNFLIETLLSGAARWLWNMEKRERKFTATRWYMGGESV